MNDVQFEVQRPQAIKACTRMRNFYLDLKQLYTAHGIDLEANRGRRNILMSGPMEKFLAEEMHSSGLYDSVINDGRTGCADILVNLLSGDDIELECKLTSPTQSSGSITFQTDHDTLLGKGSLDYVYIIADPSFEKFCVVHFMDLTVEDFRNLSPGARGKVQMYKYHGMEKANVLVGSVISSKDVKIKKITEAFSERNIQTKEDIRKWKSRLSILNPDQHHQRDKLSQQIIRAQNKYDECLNKMEEEIRIASLSKARYTFNFEEIK
jgi:hypothetical protein